MIKTVVRCPLVEVDLLLQKKYDYFFTPGSFLKTVGFSGDFTQERGRMSQDGKFNGEY